MSVDFQGELRTALGRVRRKLQQAVDGLLGAARNRAGNAQKIGAAHGVPALITLTQAAQREVPMLPLIRSFATCPNLTGRLVLWK